MKKVRDIPEEWKGAVDKIATPEYQEHLRTLVAEEGQLTLAKKFMEGKEDHGRPLFDLDYEVLQSNYNKPVPANLDEKHSIWEEGDDVCYSYGVLTLRGLIRWTVEQGKKHGWLMPTVTEQGEQALLSHS